MTVYFYGRCSSSENFDKGSSLETQLSKCKSYADIKDLSIDEFCQYLIGNNKKVYSYEVDDFLCLGTPQEFRNYEYWIDANEIATIN